MANNEIMVKDLSTTSSLSTDNKLMLLTDEANNRVQNITVENALANFISSNANNSLSIGTDKKLYSADISGEVGDLDNLITTNKTDIISAINEVKGDTNAITGEVVSASKGWLEEGKIYQKSYWYGEKIYNDVHYYNHSTFDVSKFTVTGSPIITDDGIITTADSSNYAQLNFDFSQDHTFEIEINGNNTTATTIRPFNNGYQMYINPNNSNRCLLYVNSGASYLIATITDEALKSNYTLKIRIKKVGLTYTIDYVINGTITGTLTTTLATTPTYETYIRFQGSLDEQHSVNLKTLAIWNANGYPIFSGTKTGIDTIKPDDYTVVGTPTISADGIASGFSSSNYIQTNFTYNDFVTKLNFIWNGTNPSGSSFIFKIQTTDNHEAINIYQKTNGYLDVIARVSNSSYYDFTNFAISANLPVLIEIVKTSTSLTINATQNGTSIYSKTVTTHIPTFDNSSFMQIGKDTVQGSIDLNSIKFYVNGDLVYQPCLFIPYTESSTGSKIVDVAYRNRVIDVYNQFGSANYYTIDEVNQNATLPMGEIYGFIEQKQNSIDNIFDKIVPVYNDNLRIDIGHSPYTTPDNGYIYCPQLNSSTSLLLFIQTNSSGPVNMVNCSSGTNCSFCLPVPKNARITATTEDANLHIYFMPAQG